MEKNWKEEQLRLLDSEECVFKYIPNDIGDILYCDTNNPQTEPLTEKEVRKRKILAPCVSTIFLLLYWGLLYEHYIWGTLLSIIIIFIGVNYFNTKFQGTDYFVGKNGFCIIKFSDIRTNVTETEKVLFENISYLFTSEVKNKRNFSYNNTEYIFSLYRNQQTDNGHCKLVYKVTGSYEDEDPFDPMNPSEANEEYCMMKMVELAWTQYFFELHNGDAEISFPFYKDGTIFTNALILNNSGVRVGDVLYTRENTKRIYYSDGNLVIEHENHKTKFFGLIEKGNSNTIPLSKIGNRKAFLMLFDSVYSS